MNHKNIVIVLLVGGMLGGAGFGLYRLGLQQGMTLSAAPGGSTSVASERQAAATATVDPSTWGIPEGEAATRRHIEAGLKGGEVDPVTGRRVLYYHDPMVPGKKFEVPGKSPFMNMMLVPAYAGGEGADASTVTVSSRIQQNLGLRTGEVTEGRLAPEILAVGALAWNERDQVVVQARSMGFVEKLHVRATLDPVARGQALFDLYVPDWVAAQEDFLALRRMRGSDLAPLVDAARQRMRQAGMDEAQIGLVEKSNAVQARMTLHAPIGGVLTEFRTRRQYRDAGHDAGTHQRHRDSMGACRGAREPGRTAAHRCAGQGAQSGPAGYRLRGTCPGTFTGSQCWHAHAQGADGVA